MVVRVPYSSVKRSLSHFRKSRRKFKWQLLMPSPERLNYNRYGARGWDLLPHGDTIRDVPYLFKDWMRRVLNTIQGGDNTFRSQSPKIDIGSLRRKLSQDALDFAIFMIVP